MSASYNSTIQKASGSIELTSTMTIPRQRGSLSSRVVAPYGGVSYALGGGKLVGTDRNATILKARLGLTGAMVESENYGSSTVGHYWNGNNTQGDTNLRTTAATLVKDIGFDGSGLLRPTPYNYLDRKIDPTQPSAGQYAWEYEQGNDSAPHDPDIYGPDIEAALDGLRLQGTGNHVDHCRFFQIPGYALSLAPGNGTQAGVPGIYDDYASFVEHVIIRQCKHGIVLTAGDSKLQNLYFDGIAGDAFTMGGSGSVIDNIHVAGSDRGLVWYIGGQGSNLYCEASRIGVHVLAGSVHMRGLNIGPGTAYYRGVLIDEDACNIDDFFGIVRAEDSDWSDIAGIEILGGYHHYLRGQLVVLGSQKGIIINNSHRGFLDVQGSIVSASDNARFVDIRWPITGWRVTIQGNSTSNAPLLDFTSSGLSGVNGLGNNFRIYCASSNVSTAVKYSTASYNLAAGNSVYINDVLQS